MLKLTSDPMNIGQVENFVKKLFSRHNIEPRYYPNILISLTEAVQNAITHGNGEDNSKYVRIFSQLQDNILAIRVCDEGRGFDYDCLPDPTTPDNIYKLGGRGVFLIQELSDKVRFFDEGRTVEMEFYIHGK